MLWVKNWTPVFPNEENGRPDRDREVNLPTATGMYELS